jgi:hypothetical protein
MDKEWSGSSCAGIKLKLETERCPLQEKVFEIQTLTHQQASQTIANNDTIPLTP